jgi:5-formyltetrahydrofolate cyclo-ligase
MVDGRDDRSGDKRDARRAALLRRSALSPAQLEQAGQRLAAIVGPLAVGAGTVAAYASLGAEPATGPLLAALAGRRVLLPVLREDDDLDWAELTPAGLAEGRRGLLEPVGPRLGPDAVAGCGLVVVPALRVDRRGVRLGRGGGSYDRALSRATGRTVALLHDGELVDALPCDRHDVPVSAAALPSAGVVHLPVRPLG